MVNIDDNIKILMEVVAQTFKLSQQALLHVLKSLTKLLKNKEQPPKDYILDEKTKVSTQKINEIIKKKNKNDGVIALNIMSQIMFKAALESIRNILEDMTVSLIATDISTGNDYFIYFE
ncbi:hypothetical protein [Bacillus wiedmannii]|uniref:hypothetical protein n=1 Tax=Bacillus wiedmannii TaxID=1890302 RepID=UPI00159BD478|nr:hypothetical protein [Bacillus wiedmannii]